MTLDKKIVSNETKQTQEMRTTTLLAHERNDCISSSEHLRYQTATIANTDLTPPPNSGTVCTFWDRRLGGRGVRYY